MKIEEMTREELLEFFGNVYRATCMLLSDRPEETVDANFFHARSHNDYDDLFEQAAELYHKKITRYVVVNGGDGRHRNGSILGEAWPGADFWVRELTKRGVQEKDIHRTVEALNTKEENQGFLEIAKAHKWRRAVITGCQPHQILRAFLGFLKSMADNDYWMRVYAVVPREKPMLYWWHPIYSSSAMYTPEELPPVEERWRKPFELLPEEFLKIPDYQAKGHLATFEKLFEYLKVRHALR